MSTSPSLQNLGRYELIREVGKGASGVVYKARDPQLDRVVAVRAVAVPPGLTEAQRAGFERRFFEEARRAASLSHPGLVVAHDVGKDPASGLLFVVFEYVEGITLAERLAQGPPFVWREAARLLARVAVALHHAHAAGVVHRDLRPANIVVVASGEAKVLDFGVARLETARMTLSSIREAFGAPLYMSPEQAVGESVDARSDVFSLGAIAFRLLAGRDAFAAADPRAVLA
ncbi:MAG: serine/threonine-protein kinase, partial [Planctomycetota bacterium]